MTETPARYRQRPIEAEAVQWTGHNADALRAFAGIDFDTIDPADRIEDPDQDAQLLVEASHWVGIRPGDWVLKFEGYFVAKSDVPFRAVWEPAASAVVPSAPADRAALRDRIADTLAATDGWRWASASDKALSSAYRGYQTRADAVLAVLPEPADRAAILREAADIAEAQRQFEPATGTRKSAQVSENVGILRAADSLRRMADEAQQPAPWLSDSARIGRTLIWTWADIGKGVYGQGYRAAQAEARALLTGQRDSVEAQQPETQTLPQPEGPEYTPCECDHIEPEHEPNAGACWSCDCEGYRATPPAPLRRSEDDCPGFPEQCPNILPVDPDPPIHYGGIRCGCADQPDGEAQQPEAEVDATILAQLQQHLAEHTPSCNARTDHLMRRAAWALGAPRPTHIGGNAEDCPACHGTNPNYPFICPGPDTA
jgi:hypothetical protein